MAPNASARSCGQVRAPSFVLPAVAAMVSSRVQSIRQVSTGLGVRYPLRTSCNRCHPSVLGATPRRPAPPAGRRGDPHQVFVGRPPGGSPSRCPRRVLYTGTNTCDLPVVGSRRDYGRVPPGRTGQERSVLAPCATGDHGVRTLPSPCSAPRGPGPADDEGTDG